MSTAPPHRVRLTGRIISPGLAVGIARLEEPLLSESTPATVAEGDVENELAKLTQARELVRAHLKEHVRGEHAPAPEDLKQIVAAHVLVLDDLAFFGSIEDRIRTRRYSADRAVSGAFSAAVSRLAESNDGYMRARAEDLRDICLAIRRALVQGAAAFQPHEFGDTPTVLVVSHLRPSTVLRARREGAIGFVTSSTAFASHGAILLRSAGIPALGDVALQDTEIQDGTPLLVDALHGELVVHPPPDELSEAQAQIASRRAPPEDKNLVPLDATLRDGEEVRLFANIDHPSQAGLCFAHRLRGIGLFRTELLASDTGAVPDEEAQYRILRDLVDTLAGRPLIIRTFDFGADKEPVGIQGCEGQNPALGLRGIRRHLHRYPGELRTQLRAILRAAVDADVSILLPMVTHAGDVSAVIEHLAQVRQQLTAQGVPFNPNVKLGAMVEIPSAALAAGELLEVVDFLSVGTNDLVQYLTAADRENPAVLDYQAVELSGLYRMLEIVMQEARGLDRQQDISVCGELASDPAVAVELVRLGLRSLSVTPHTADAVREALKAAVVAS